MKQKILLIFWLAVFFAFKNSFSQNSISYKIGDTVKESIQLYDTAINPVNFKIPTKGYYVLVYRYRTVSVGKGVDNADSIKMLEDKISSILLGGMIGNLKVICLSYDKINNYEEWLHKIKTERPFKLNSKYKVEYLNLNGNAQSESKCRQLFTKLTMISPVGRILRHSSSIAKFDYHMKDNVVNVKGKLLTNENGKKEPLVNTLVHIQAGNKIDTLGKGTTDKFGDFDIKIPNNDTAYTIKVDPKDKNIKNLILLTQEGKEIASLNKSFSKFSYKLLKSDILELAEIPIDDNLTFSFKKFDISKQKELLVVESIIYGLAKYELEKDAEEKLNEIVLILKNNPKIKLEIKSYTDSQGDDQVNLELSKKRALYVADYLVKNGIEQNKITAIGKGESDIRNRCLNGVSCSDKEHKYNRRTEFNFIK